jgi:hypothetical protein
MGCFLTCQWGKVERAQHLAAYQAPSLWIRIDNDRHAARNELTFFRGNSQFLRHAD